MRKAATTRRVYLPEGAWLDWWPGEKFEGCRWIERPVDLETLPLYVRAGAFCSLGPARQYALYNDAGQSLDNRDNSDARTVWSNVRWNDAKRELTIATDPR